MNLRNGNIIVCDCGIERNPDISTPYDLIQYADGVATCSNCGASGAIEFPQPPTEPLYIDPIVALEEKIDGLSQLLVIKNVITKAEKDAVIIKPIKDIKVI